MPPRPLAEANLLLLYSVAALCLVGVLAGVCAAAWPFARPARGATVAGRALLVVLAAAPALHALTWSGELPDPPTRWAALLGLTLACLGFHHVLACRLLQAVRGLLPLAVCGAGLSLGVWTVWQLERTTGVLFAGLSPEQHDADFKARWFPDGVIQTDPPGGNYVCHDWTFGLGPGRLDTPDVDVLLWHQGYLPVETPALGDVVVYRDPAGNALHSGVVKALGQDQLVLIESKWGAHSRFIHGLEVRGFRTPYTTTFYRQVVPGY